MRYWQHPDGRLESCSNDRNKPDGFNELTPETYAAERAKLPPPPETPPPRDVLAELDALTSTLKTRGIIE